MPDSISFRLITILPFISHGYIIQSRSRMHKMSLAVSSISRGYGQNLFSAKTHSVCVSVCVPYNKNRTFRLGFFSASIVLTGTAERGGPTAEQKKKWRSCGEEAGGGGWQSGKRLHSSRLSSIFLLGYTRLVYYCHTHYYHLFSFLVSAMLLRTTRQEKKKLKKKTLDGQPPPHLAQQKQTHKKDDEEMLCTVGPISAGCTFNKDGSSTSKLIEICETFNISVFHTFKFWPVTKWFKIKTQSFRK